MAKSNDFMPDKYICLSLNFQDLVRHIARVGINNFTELKLNVVNTDRRTSEKIFFTIINNPHISGEVAFSEYNPS